MVRVTLPLILPGLGAAAALVFLATVTELTATLLLAPIGTQTLATAVLGQGLDALLRSRRALRCSDGRDLGSPHLPADPPTGRRTFDPGGRNEPRRRYRSSG